MSYDINGVSLTKQQFKFCKDNGLVVLKTSFSTSGGVNNGVSVSFCKEKTPFSAIVTGVSLKDFNSAFINAKKQYLNNK